MKRLLSFALIAAFAAVVPAGAQDVKKIEELKKGLQALNDFVGTWNGDGKSAPTKPKKETWAETLDWSWRFKGDDVWMTWKLKDGKVFKSGELRYVPATKNFQLTAIDAKDQKVVFEGTIEKEILNLERTDPTTKETQRVRVNVAGDGVRLNMAVTRRGSGKTLFSPEYQIGYAMEGASLAGKEKKQECIVSGGLGSGTVAYQGKNYPICCSGCRDAFNENPTFYIKMFESKKK